jgi:predicted nucleotidyltransferase
MTMDGRVKERVEEFLADLERSAVRRHVLGVVVSGSAARGEEIWDGERLLSDIDLMVLTRRTSPRLIAAVERVVSRHRIRGIDGGAVPLGPLAGYLTCAFYEARCNGVVVHGSVDLERLVPPTHPHDLPLWEGVRVLANRVLEHVKYDAGEISAPRVVAKSYEALAEAYLLVEGRYRPSYAERLAELELLPPEAPAEAVASMLAVLRTRLDGTSAPVDVDQARAHLLDGLATVAARYTGVAGGLRAQLDAIAGRERHWKHRLFWSAVLVGQRRWSGVRLTVDPVVDVWRRAVALAAGRPSDRAERLRVLGDWRACPQILVRRRSRELASRSSCCTSPTRSRGTT